MNMINIPNDWQNSFDIKYLVRGWEYYKSDFVKDFVIDKSTIFAKVTGSSVYDVLIETAPKKALKMTCTCPCAEKHKRCKHMTAVLYKASGQTISDDIVDEYYSYDEYDEWESEEDAELYCAFNDGYIEGYRDCSLDARAYMTPEQYEKFIKDFSYKMK